MRRRRDVQLSDAPLDSKETTWRMRRRRPKNFITLEPWPDLPATKLRQLAVGIIEGHVVGTWRDAFQRDPNLAMMVFMPLAAMDGRQLATYQERGVNHIYADLREDGTAGRAINGWPMFYACRFLNKADSERLQGLLETLAADRAAFLAAR